MGNRFYILSLNVFPKLFAFYHNFVSKILKLQTSEAAEMLKHNNENLFKEIEQWADLGCGSGTFTFALATLLQHESIIHAIDSNASLLKQIPSSYYSIKIEKEKIDFINENIHLKNLDGILMANSLHYVSYKKKFLTKSIESLKENGCFLIVEYDTEIPVPTWVPYPINFSSLKELFMNAGYKNIIKLNERASVYGPIMYSALIER